MAGWKVEIKNMKKTFSIAGLLSFTVGAVSMAVGISSTIVNLTFQAQPDPLLMGGMSPNDYATNFELVVLGSTDCTVPTNQWPVLMAVPATQFTNQGPFGSDWTVSVPTTSNPTFFFLQFTNFNTSGGSQGRGPFSSVVAWVSGAPPGKLKKVQ